MGACTYCGLEDDDLETDEEGEEMCMDCLYTYDRVRHNELMGETDEDD